VKFNPTAGNPRECPRAKKYIVNTVCDPVKYKYCVACKKTHVKSRLEKDTCIYCGKPCEVVDIKRNRMYYLGYGIVVIGAILMIILRLQNSDFMLLLVTGFVFIFLGGATVIIASGKMAESVAEKVNNSEAKDDG
jgi:hypothetical protein